LRCFLIRGYLRALIDGDALHEFLSMRYLLFERRRRRECGLPIALSGFPLHARDGAGLIGPIVALKRYLEAMRRSCRRIVFLERGGLRRTRLSDPLIQGDLREVQLHDTVLVLFLVIRLYEEVTYDGKLLTSVHAVIALHEQPVDPRSVERRDRNEITLNESVGAYKKVAWDEQIRHDRKNDQDQ